MIWRTFTQFVTLYAAIGRSCISAATPPAKTGQYSGRLAFINAPRSSRKFTFWHKAEMQRFIKAINTPSLSILVISWIFSLKIIGRFTVYLPATQHPYEHMTHSKSYDNLNVTLSTFLPKPLSSESLLAKPIGLVPEKVGNSNCSLAFVAGVLTDRSAVRRPSLRRRTPATNPQES